MIRLICDFLKNCCCFYCTKTKNIKEIQIIYDQIQMTDEEL